MKLFERQATVNGQRNFKVLGWQVRFKVAHQRTAGFGEKPVSLWYHANYAKILQRFTFMGHGFRHTWFFSIGKI